MDILLYLCDTCITLWAFLDVFPLACQTFQKHDFCYRYIYWNCGCFICTRKRCVWSLNVTYRWLYTEFGYTGVHFSPTIKGGVSRRWTNLTLVDIVHAVLWELHWNESRDPRMLLSGRVAIDIFFHKHQNNFGIFELIWSSCVGFNFKTICSTLLRLQ